jgi:hypothetical protein
MDKDDEVTLSMEVCDGVDEWSNKSNKWRRL